MRIIKKTLCVITTLIVPFVSKAQTSWLPETGRLSAQGSVSSNVRSVGGDGLLPVYGNKQDGFAFADIMGNYGSDNAYFVSPGLGGRKIIEDQIIGGYFFGDYDRTSLGTNFWVLSPGIEWMNTHWDAHVNGYFPTSTMQQSGSTDYASNYGNYNSVKFETGTHNQYDEIVTPYAVIGNGGDAELGYSFSEINGLRSRVYMGGYFYAPPSYDNVDNITGVTAGFEQPFSKNLSISVFNSYDNVNNYVVGVSLRMTFGQDSTVFSNNISDRLNDPVARHVGIINTGAGTYDEQYLKEMGQGLQYDNVYFVAPTDENASMQGLEGAETTSSPDDIGTYGNAAPLDQTTLDTINTQSPEGARIYIQGGENANYYVNSSTATQSTVPNYDYGLVLYSNQDLYGRTPDYTAPAEGDDRPQILVDGQNNYNGFIISGSENTLSDLIITTESGYINNSIATSSTGVIAFNETQSNQTININNTDITHFADGMYAQNDSNTGTMTINTDNSSFDNNGGDEGLDNMQLTGYNDYGSSGLIAINNSGASNLIINTSHSSFNNNGTLSGEGSGINNNNFSVASGITAINNSNTGALTLNATHSSFDNNGTLSGDNTYILANEQGPVGNPNSINTAAATGIYARDNSTNNGALTINADYSTFDNNGTLSGENAQIHTGDLTNIAPGNGAGDNVNTAVASGVYLFNNSAGSALMTLNAHYSTFDNNGILSGTAANITTLANNQNIGASQNAATAAGVFAFNNSNNSGSINLNATHSHFDNNGTLSGENALIYAHTTNINEDPESVVASASGIVAYNSNSQGSNEGAITINADSSSFNNNSRLSGNNATIRAVNDQGLNTGSSGIASASGITGYNIAIGDLVINATNSEFHNNGAWVGIGNSINASGSDINSAGSSGLFVLNNSGVNGDIFVNNLSGSSFNNNGAGTDGYGIYAFTPDITGVTSVNYTGATFGGSPQTNTNQEISDGTPQTQWTY